MPENKGETAIKGMVRNTIYNAFTSIIGRLGGLIFTVLLARLLLPELFGIYGLVLSIILLFLTAIDSGINSSLIKYVSEAFNKKQESKARAYFQFWFYFKLIISGIVAAALLLFAKPISIYIFQKPLLTAPLQVGAVYLFSSSILTSFVSLAYSIRKVRYVMLQEVILQGSKVLLVAFFILILKSSSIALVFLALLLSSFISILFLFNFIRKRYRRILVGDKAQIDKKKLFRFFSFLAVTGITTAIFAHVDTILLGILIPSTKLIAFYQVALTIVSSATVLITFSGNVFLPFFTHLKGKALKREFKRIFRYSFFISVPAAFGLIFIAKPFINIIFGAEYLSAALPLSILSLLLIETAAGGLFCAVFLAKDKPQYQMNVFIATSIFYTVLSLILIKTFASINPAYSILGAAIATLVSRYSAFFSLAVIANKKLHIKPDLKPIFKSIFSAGLMLVFLIGIDKIFHLTFPLAVLEVIFGGLFYLGIMWMTKAIVKEDIDLIKSIFIKQP